MRAHLSGNDIARYNVTQNVVVSDVCNCELLEVVAVNNNSVKIENIFAYAHDGRLRRGGSDV